MEERQDIKIEVIEDKAVKLGDGVIISKPKEKGCKQNKKELSPYQKYKQSKNKNGKRYFDFYDDIKVYTHNIYDW